MNKKINLINLLLMAFATFQVGCVSMSTLQTARTLKEGDSQQSIGGGVYNSKVDIGGIKTESNLPYIEYSYRRGLSEKFDAGLKLTFIGAYAVDGKYQIYGGEKMAVATGLGLGYLSYKVSSGGQDQEIKFFDIMLPLYFSYDINSSFAIYLAPKYIVRAESGASSKSENLVGTTVGAKIGENSGVYLEASMIKPKDSEAITQYNLSYFW